VSTALDYDRFTWQPEDVQWDDQHDLSVIKRFNPAEVRNERGEWSRVADAALNRPQLAPARGAELPADALGTASPTKLKAQVAERIANAMKSSTHDMVLATVLPGSIRGNPVFGNDKVDAQDVLDRPEKYAWGVKDGGVIALAPAGVKVKIGGNFSRDLLMNQAADDLPAFHAALRNAAAAGLVKRWASSANDHDARSLATQRAVEDEFGLKNTATWDITDADETFYRLHSHVYRDFIRAQYSLTQRDLAEAGITGTVQLHRGFSWDDMRDAPNWVRGVNAGEGDRPDEIPIPPLRPLSSWTSDQQIAESFSSDEQAGKVGIMISADVPVTSILSTPKSGMGCLDEFECVVIAPPDGQNGGTAHARGY
jgi:hypothetical protein